MINRDLVWELNSDPWMHTQCTSPFFKTEVYNKLIDILYSDEVESWPVFNTTGDPAYPYGQVVMIDDELRKNSTGFMREFYEWMHNNKSILEDAMYESTGQVFKNYSILWHLDYPGFDQGSHNDLASYPGREVTTFQVYMARDTKHASSGVHLQKVQHGSLISQVPYLPNHAWGFKANAETWHTVEKIHFYRPSFLIRNFKRIET